MLPQSKGDPLPQLNGDIILLTSSDPHTGHVTLSSADCTIVLNAELHLSQLNSYIAFFIIIPY